MQEHPPFPEIPRLGTRVAKMAFHSRQDVGLMLHYAQRRAANKQRRGDHRHAILLIMSLNININHGARLDRGSAP